MASREEEGCRSLLGLGRGEEGKKFKFILRVLPTQDDIKKMCKPCVIQILEAMNPDNIPQTDQEMELSETDSE